MRIAARPSGRERRWKMRIDRWIEQGRSLSSLNMISIMGNLWYLVAATPPPKAQEHNPKSVKCFRVFASAGEFIFKYGFTEAYCLASLAAALHRGPDCSRVSHQPRCRHALVLVAEEGRQSSIRRVNVWMDSTKLVDSRRIGKLD